MKVKLTERGKKIADEIEIPREVRTRFNAVLENKERDALPIKNSNGIKCNNCDVLKHSDNCIGCQYDW